MKIYQICEFFFWKCEKKSFRYEGKIFIEKCGTDIEIFSIFKLKKEWRTQKKKNNDITWEEWEKILKNKNKWDLMR